MTFTQPSSPATKPEERCTMEVNGVYFSDRETVWIHRSWDGNPYAEFRFTCGQASIQADVDVANRIYSDAGWGQ